MKKIILLLMLFLPICLSARDFELYCSIDGVSTGGPFFEDDSVRFDFDYSMALYPQFLNVKVTNKTDTRITVEWENARIGNNPVYFKSDNAYSYGNPKPDEVIHATSSSAKGIGIKQGLEHMVSIFYESSIKSHGESVRSIILPIRYASGKVVDYKMYVCLKYKY